MFLMHDMHDYSNLILGCVAKHSAVRGVRIHPHWEELFIEFMVCFFTTMWPPGEIFSPGSHGASQFLVPNLFRENPHFVVTIVFDVSWRVPTGEPIANSIQKCLLIHGSVVRVLRY